MLLGAVVLNWTLHFIPDEGKRFAYLKDVYSALLPGGILVSCKEKVFSRCIPPLPPIFVNQECSLAAVPTLSEN